MIIEIVVFCGFTLVVLGIGFWGGAKFMKWRLKDE
jgi:hypothetical protein